LLKRFGPSNLYQPALASGSFALAPALHFEVHGSHWVRDRARSDCFARPDPVRTGLPKTGSGTIMRRILRKIAEDEPSSLGDTSTLADPAVVDDLVQNRQNKRGACLDQRSECERYAADSAQR
jgi:hypothetical protein